MKALLLAACALLVATPALAGQAVSLKAETTDSDGRVTLGDLFDGAGSASDVVVGGRTGPSAVLDAGQVQMAAHRAGLDWDNPQGLRRIIVRQGVEAAEAAAPRAGRGNVEVLAYARSLATGEVVQPQDLIWTKVAAAPADAPSDPEAMIGMSARRPLREGAAAALRDVSSPTVIKAGDVVTVTFEDGGVSVSLTGKAMAAAAAGDSVAVQNTASKKILDAMATGPGAAVIGPQAIRLRAARSTLRYAAR
ncbi:MAG: flagellar basal body P-ring formation protein FlgA [Caulobacter sp.]|nr:flagellar basal body P-ring formation protein FlgA [Caulobacter sp.]